MDFQNEVYNILTSVSSLTGLGVCLYDFENFFAYNYGRLEKLYTGHYCRFCKAVRDLNGGREACIKNDVEMVKKLAYEYKKPFFNVCHAGICEYIIPITDEKNLLGIVFIGQCRIKGETEFDNIRKNLFHYNAEPDYFKKLFDELPSTSRLQLSSVGKLADCSFKMLVGKGNFEISALPSNIASEAKKYIDLNYMNKLTLSGVSNKLHVNPSYLSRVFKEKNGKNISLYINEIKINKAKHLLKTTKIPIAHISYNLGFTDQNYFSRVFKQITGDTPQKYRSI